MSKDGEAVPKLAVNGENDNANHDEIKADEHDAPRSGVDKASSGRPSRLKDETDGHGMKQFQGKKGKKSSQSPSRLRDRSKADDAKIEPENKGNKSCQSPSQLKELLARVEGMHLNDKAAGETKEWKFWSTQPVIMDPVKEDISEPVNEMVNLDAIRKDPYALPDGFSWDTIDIFDSQQLEEVYVLLNENYVQDDDNMFRFDYSKDFLKWALCPPEWIKDWHVGIRVTRNRKLVGFISGVIATIQVRTKVIKAAEINFLCVHKQLRSKRMAPVLIREIRRRANLAGYFQAVYTSGTILPGMVGKCRYWHRSLNVKKLVEVNFSYLSPVVTLQRSIRLHRLPETTQIPGFREMRENDVPQAYALLSEYLKRFALSPIFSLEEFKHQFCSRPGIVTSFVVADKAGKVTDFASFYHLNSTILQHPKYKTLRAAYSYYNVATKTKLIDLMRDVLIVAKEQGFDVFNTLDSMENKTFLEDLKFGIGDGDLHYYLFNWQTGFMQANEIGLTLL